jgi:3-hydroxyisobutyrate dehydrogenase-like beta-hydroxyacid dehydrogenase
MSVSTGRLAVVRVGFIGTGIMGKPMAGNLLKAGCSLKIHSHTKVGLCFWVNV